MSSRKLNLRAICLGATAVIVAVLGLLLASASITTDPGGAYETTSDEWRMAHLPDGTQIRMQPNSRLNARYTAERRRVEMEIGDVRFKVAPEAGRPFVLETNLAIITGGTDFRVSCIEDTVTVTSYGGKMLVVPRGVPGAQLYVLPGGAPVTVAGKNRARIAMATTRPLELTTAFAFSVE